MRLVAALLVLVAVDALSGVAVVAPKRTSFASEVVSWLVESEIAFGYDPTFGSAAAQEVTLGRATVRLCASPQRAEDSGRAGASRRLTDAAVGGDVVHLHEDLWRSRGDIVRARLRARAGLLASRHFARKTRATRIDGLTARAFLEEHHLYGAERCAHNYGLYDDEATLVAVAAFGKRRTVQRGGVSASSYHLSRFCARKDGNVVGGISKIVKHFVRDVGDVDDITTEVDRDWGAGDGWSKLGFVVIQTMPPCAMCVGDDGKRRYLTGGAGLTAKPRDDTEGPLKLPEDVLAALDVAASPAECLADAGYYQVFDAGVTRLLLLVSDELKDAFNGSAVDAFAATPEKFLDFYASPNAGIATLLAAARNDMDRP